MIQDLRRPDLNLHEDSSDCFGHEAFTTRLPYPLVVVEALDIHSEALIIVIKSIRGYSSKTRPLELNCAFVF